MKIRVKRANRPVSKIDPSGMCGKCVPEFRPEFAFQFRFRPDFIRLQMKCLMWLFG